MASDIQVGDKVQWKRRIGWRNDTPTITETGIVIYLGFYEPDIAVVKSEHGEFSVRRNELAKENEPNAQP